MPIHRRFAVPASGAPVYWTGKLPEATKGKLLTQSCNPPLLVPCLAGFPDAVVGVQDALAQADEMRRGLYQFIRFNVFNGAFQGEVDGR